VANQIYVDPTAAGANVISFGGQCYSMVGLSAHPPDTFNSDINATFSDCDTCVGADYACADRCGCCFSSQMRLKLEFDLTEVTWWMDNGPDPGVWLPYESDDLCDDPAKPYCLWVFDYDVDQILKNTLYASPSGSFGGWYSKKSDAAFVRTDIYPDDPNPGDTTRVETYIGMTVDVSQSCQFQISVYSMFRMYINDVPAEGFADPEFLALGFWGPYIWADVAGSCCKWILDSANCGPYTSPTGYTFDTFGTLTAENNLCCRDEAGACQKGEGDCAGNCSDAEG